MELAGELETEHGPGKGAGGSSRKGGAQAQVPWGKMAEALGQDGKGLGLEGDERKLAVWRGRLPSALELDALSTALRRRRRAAGLWPAGSRYGGAARVGAGAAARAADAAGAVSAAAGAGVGDTESASLVAAQATAGSRSGSSIGADGLAELVVRLAGLPEGAAANVYGFV